jgi:hypothetical protein
MMFSKMKTSEERGSIVSLFPGSGMTPEAGIGERRIHRKGQTKAGRQGPVEEEKPESRRLFSLGLDEIVQATARRPL